MTWYLSLLAALAVLVILQAGDDRRAQAWVLVGATAFVVSYLYGKAGLPYHAAVTAAVDTSQCLLIYFFGRYRWEMHLWRLWQFSVLISILHLAGLTGGTWTYAVALELVNVAALLVIGGKGVAERWAHGRRDSPGPAGRVRLAVGALCAERRRPPFTRGGA